MTFGRFGFSRFGFSRFGFIIKPKRLKVKSPNLAQG